MKPRDRTTSTIWESRCSPSYEGRKPPLLDTYTLDTWDVVFCGVLARNLPQGPLPGARIDRSRRGEANAAPGPDQLLDLGKSIFSILRGAETPTQYLADLGCRVLREIKLPTITPSNPTFQLR